jgi:hypothetical protein
MFEIAADIPAPAGKQISYDLIAATIYLSHAFDSRYYDAGARVARLPVLHPHHLS